MPGRREGSILGATASQALLPALPKVVLATGLWAVRYSLSLESMSLKKGNLGTCLSLFSVIHLQFCHMWVLSCVCVYIRIHVYLSLYDVCAHMHTLTIEYQTVLLCTSQISYQEDAQFLQLVALTGSTSRSLPSLTVSPSIRK